jgi:predicted RNA-binding protein Jag
MSKEDYLAKLDEINSIPDKEIQQPSMPVDVFLQEAEDLYKWSINDAEKLKIVGISGKMLKDLLISTGACREAESIWNKDFRSQLEVQKQWNEAAPAAYELRSDLLAAMSYAYRNDEKLMGRVKAIREGYGHADMIQDLNDIAVLGRENATLLTAIGFDLAQLEVAAKQADQLAGLLADVNGSKNEKIKSKIIRDKAYMLLKKLVDEIRTAGKYVFRKDKVRYAGYTSSYYKNRMRTTSEPISEEPETPASEG